MSHVFYNQNDILTFVSQNTLYKGLLYTQKGHVQDIALSYKNNGNITFFGKTLGATGQIYIQKIDLQKKPLHINGTCSCSAEHNCKHVVAVLLQAIKNKTKTTQPLTQEPQPWHKWGYDIQKTTHIPENESVYPDKLKHRLLYIVEPQSTTNAPTLSMWNHTTTTKWRI